MDEEVDVNLAALREHTIAIATVGDTTIEKMFPRDWENVSYPTIAQSFSFMMSTLDMAAAHMAREARSATGSRFGLSLVTAGHESCWISVATEQHCVTRFIATEPGDDGRLFFTWAAAKCVLDAINP